MAGFLAFLPALLAGAGGAGAAAAGTGAALPTVAGGLAGAAPMLGSAMSPAAPPQFASPPPKPQVQSLALPSISPFTAQNIMRPLPTVGGGDNTSLSQMINMLMSARGSRGS